MGIDLGLSEIRASAANGAAAVTAEDAIAAARQVSDAAQARADELRVEIAEVQARVQQALVVARAGVTAGASAAREGARAAFSAAREQVQEQAQTAASQVEGQRSRSLAEVDLAGAQAHEMLDLRHEAAMTAGQAAMMEVQQAMQEVGAAEAQRAQEESAAHAAQAQTLAHMRASGDATRVEGQQRVGAEVAAEAANRCYTSGTELASAAQQAAVSAAAELATQLPEFLIHLSDAHCQATTSIEGELQSARSTVESVAVQATGALTQTRDVALAALSGQESGHIEAVDQREIDAQQELDHVEAEVADWLAPQGEQLIASLEAAGWSAAAELASMQGADGTAVAEASIRAMELLAEAKSQAASGLEGWATQTGLAIVGVREQLDADMVGLRTQAGEGASRIATGVRGELEQAAASATDAMTTAATGAARRAVEGALASADALDSATDGFVSGLWQAQVQSAQHITTQVDQGLADQLGFLQQAGAERDRGAAQAGALYDGLKAEGDQRAADQQGNQPVHRGLWDAFVGWVDSVRSWFARTFGERLGGLIFGVLSAIVVMAIGAVVLAILEAAIVAVVGLIATAAVAAKVAAIAVLVIGAVAAVGLGIYSRFAEFSEDNGDGPSFWQGVGLVALGILDITGIPLVIEGLVGQRAFGRELTPFESWERLGMGATFLFAGLRGLRALFRGRARGRSLGLAKEEATTLRETMSRGQQPRAVSVVVNKITGKVYKGTSGKPYPTEIHPALKDRMPDPSMERWAPENCAEFKAVNEALLDGATFGDLEVSTVIVRSGEAFPRCNNCQKTTDGVDVITDAATPKGSGGVPTPAHTPQIETDNP
jgi:hypothetical protein